MNWYSYFYNTKSPVQFPSSGEVGDLQKLEAAHLYLSSRGLLSSSCGASCRIFELFKKNRKFIFLCQIFKYLNNGNKFGCGETCTRQHQSLDAIF